MLENFLKTRAFLSIKMIYSLLIISSFLSIRRVLRFFFPSF